MGNLGILGNLIEAAQAAHLGGRVQENLHLGLGKDDRADIAALHDDSALGDQFLLHLDHPGANGRMNTHARGGIGDGLIAQQAGHVLTVEQDAIALLAGFEANGSVRGKSFQGRALVQRHSCPEGLEREGAVHGAGFQIQQAKVAGQMAGNGTLSRAGWPVNSDNNFANRIGRAKRRVTHPRFFVPCLGRAEKPNLLLLPVLALAATAGFRLLPA